MPRYRDARYGGETVVLQNAHLRLEVHRRVSGWGWGELFVPDPEGGPDRFFAVLEHLAEIHLEAQMHPLRLEAKTYDLRKTGGEQTLTFDVVVQSPGVLQESWGGANPASGRVTLVLPKDEPVIHYSVELEFLFPVWLRSLRGPWLRIGVDTFRTARHDAIFPGIEWLVGDEWSSGNDYIEHPHALRLTPHPHKVAIPLMAISHEGVTLGLSWDPNQRFDTEQCHIVCPQPVFASPNFVDRRPHHLMGLMYPSACHGLKEDELKADPPMWILRGHPSAPFKMILSADICVGRGTSLDVVTDWVKRHGMPEPAAPRYEWQEAFGRVASAYNDTLWVDGEGWVWEHLGRQPIPWVASHYSEYGHDRKLAKELAAKVEWCRKNPADELPEPSKELPVEIVYRWVSWYGGLHMSFEVLSDDELRRLAEALLEIQTPEGDFPFDPDGRHRTWWGGKSALWRPLGQPGDSAVDLCVTAARSLMVAGERLKEGKYLDAARKTLEFAFECERPEGGDWWETPLHSPNLIAAGNSATAYFLGYKSFGDERYLEKARHWIRCLLPFTHLWQPTGMEMLYNTKPCFNDTAWFISDWTAKHVQWEVLVTFALSDELGIDWAEVDPEIDWATYQRGVTVAALRWTIDHNDPDWMLKSEYPLERTDAAKLDGTMADTFNPVHGTYGGGPCWPDAVARNVAIVMRREGLV